ncbi:MAG: polysaccharide deacetylase family protein [Candidatus Kerfeldbacteria bacterium]|nr:polysaccharide deacetylase family protein [Candidatus Kerfeldbacteria bacterium]
MADIQRYRPRRSSTPGGAWRRWLGVLIGLGVLFWIGSLVFGGKPSSSQNDNQLTNDSDISLTTDNRNTNTVTSNANTATTANTNTAAQAAPGTWENFSLTSCPKAISEYGTKKEVALTFDIAAANDQAKEVLRLLQEHRTPADFFVTGAMVAKDTNFIKSISDAGFAVYNHGQENKDLTVMTNTDIAAQISKGEAAIMAVTGITPKPMFRPAFGNSNTQTVKLARQAGYCTVLWTVDAFDWKSDVTAEQAKQRVLDKLRPGAIILLHAGYDITPTFLNDLVSAISGQGYTLVSLAQLMNG